MATSEGPVYVYVRERNGAKIIVGFGASVVFATTFLFALGFAISFVGFRPPTFDARILEDQWARRVNDAPVSYDSCVAKGGRIIDGGERCEYEQRVYAPPVE